MPLVSFLKTVLNTNLSQKSIQVEHMTDIAASSVNSPLQQSQGWEDTDAPFFLTESNI